MTGRFFCCGDDVGTVGNFKSATTLCNHRGSHLYTVKNGTHGVLLGPNNIEPAEFIWTVKGSHMKTRPKRVQKGSLIPA